MIIRVPKPSKENIVGATHRELIFLKVYIHRRSPTRREIRWTRTFFGDTTVSFSVLWRFTHASYDRRQGTEMLFPVVFPRRSTTLAIMAPQVLVIDNYDSFVYILVQYLGELGIDPLVLSTRQIS